MSKVKITDNRNTTRSTVRGCDIPEGQYFTGSSSCVSADDRSLSRLVAIDRPDEWRSAADVTIYNYRPVDVEIVVTDPKE